ncbi:hypothetical protein BA93_00765 [Finegoldia magna ALB8]|uniref:cell wall-binding repeat-containing protein n=1 Tax=Finegoldia magna TaxID=1260 RepID=UPI00044AC51D|nr:cell wall-binding repeat-containing protein [Finegoldia magna]EXF27355.1 hypothetical protein BA93_00765 [Finegoldia magna ALB8]
MEKTITKKLAKQLIALLLVFNMMLSVIAPAISFAQANEAEDNRILSVVDEKGNAFNGKVNILFKDVNANKKYSVTTENGKIDLSTLPKNTALNVQFENKGDLKNYDLLDFEGKYSYIYNDSHLVVDNGSSDKSEKKLDKIRIKKVSPMEVKVLDEQGYLITEPIEFLFTDKFNGISPTLTSKDGYLDFSGIKVKDPNNFFQAKVSFPKDKKLKLKYASDNQDEMDIAFNQGNTEVQVIQPEGFMARRNHSIIIEGYKRPEKNPEETETPAEKNTDYQLEILDSKTNKKITEEIEFKFVDTFDDDEEYLQNIKSKDGILDLSQIEDKDTTYKVSIVNNDKYKITNLLSAKGKPATLKFNGKEIQATAGDGDPAVLKSLVLENTKPETKPAVDNDYKLEILDSKTNKKITEEIEFKFVDAWTFEGEDVYTKNIKSKDGILDLSQLEDKGTMYDVSIVNNDKYKITNLFTADKKPAHIKFDGKKILASDGSGKPAVIKSLVLQSEKKEETPDTKELKDKEIATIQDIKVVYEDGQPVEDNLHFHTFNKENKDMHDYYTKDGYLKGVKAPVGSRMKLGLAELTEFLTLTNGKVPHKYFNYIWFKTDNKSVAKSYDIQTKQTGEKIEKIIVVQRQSLIGNEPKNKERANISIDVYDTTAKRKLNEKSVLFSLVGAHQEETVEAKDGRLDLDLYKDTMYTIKLDASIQHPYKSDGIRIQTKDGKTLLDEQGNKLDRIDVFQGSYLSRIYVIHGQKHVNKDIKFRIEEVGNPNNVQIRSKEGLFLNMDVMMDKTYKISMEGKDDEYFMEKPIEFKLAKSPDDGLYWPMVDDRYPEQGKDHKLKAVFLKRYDGKDNELPGLDDNTDCPTCPGKPEAEEEPQSSCNVSTVKIKTKPINVELPEGADKNDLVFKLFNSSKQRYEGEFKLNENNQLPALDLYEHNSYFIQLISKDYKMFNQYIQAYKNNEYAYNFKKNMLQDKLVVTKKTPFEGLKTDVERMLALLTNGTDGKHQFNLRLINKGQIVPNTKIRFSSEFDTFEVTSDNKGVIKVRLYEDVTYNLRSLDDKYVIDTFPLVVKDKTEWGTEGTKLLFDHSSCNGIQDIKLIDAKQGKVNGQVTCRPGNTTITGADFKQLSLLAYHLDNNNYPMLKGKEAMVLDLVLINSMRQNCEKSKFADGDFTILRKIPTGKEVADVYFINKDNTKEKLTFKQKDNIVKITGVHSLGIKPLAIEYKSNAVEFPEDPTKPGKENPGTVTPSVPGTVTPSVPGTTTPSNPGTTTPSNPGTTTPSNPGTTTPSNPGTTTPSNPGTTTPSNPGTTTPSVPGTTTPAQTTKETTRVAGADRINTSVEVSKKYYKSAETVIIANSEKFADSLSASALSKALKAPILLVQKDQLDSVVAQEIKRLGAKNVVVIGGEQSVDEAKNSLSKYNVQTIAGSDRYETSAKIAQEIIKRTGTTQAVIASGETFADALTVAPLANKNNMPILLVQPNNIPKATQEVLKQINKVIIVGGEKTISNQVANKLPNATRIAGANRYETAKKIYEYGFKDRKEVNIANGTNFVDSLVIGSIDCPILLAESNEVPESTKEAIKDSKFEKVNVFGGENSIDESVVKELIK